MSKLDKAFWSSVGALIISVLVLGTYIYINGIVNPLQEPSGTLEKIMQIDTIFGIASFASTIVIAALKRLFQ